MPRSSSADQLGGKLGPKLVDLVVQATLATRRGLATHEARVRQAATQAIIDRAGHEIGGHHRELIQMLLDADPDMHEHLAAYLRNTASGKDQWKAISGFLGITGITGGLGTIMTNFLAPAVQAAVATDPLIRIDQNAAAQAVAQHIFPIDVGALYAREAGYNQVQFDYLVQLATNIPDLSTLTDMHNRGLLPQDGMQAWLMRAGYPEGVVANMVALARQLLTPADAALAVLRGSMTVAEGQRIAAYNGMDTTDFGTVIDNTGEPLGLMQLLEAYRRGIINRATLERGIKQSRVRDEWIATAEALRYQPIGTADAVDAWQRGHITAAKAATIAELNGVEPDQVQILMDNAGNPPAPEQLLELWRRGKISEALVNEGIVQGRTRTTWAPFIKDLRYQRMSTADALDAWQRGHITQAAARTVAEENGTEPADVQALLDNVGNPPSNEQLLELWRRGKISAADVDKGIREGRTRDEWITAIKDLRYSPMSTADAVEASVQGQLSKAEAEKIATQNGLDPKDFEALWNTAGEPLARTELQQLYNRRKISAKEYAQGLRESRLKDKYVGVAMDLHERLPEPRTVTEALADGVISAEAATKMLAEDGYSPAVTEMLVKVGTIRSTGPYRQLMAQQIGELYADRIIGGGAAANMLTRLHYSGGTANLILALAEHTRDTKIRQAAITAIRGRYLAYASTPKDATADLLALGYPAVTAELYLQTWTIERKAHVKTLTEAQIVKAVKNGLLVEQGKLTTAQWEAKNHAAGLDRLEKLGYTTADAGLLLAGA